MPDELWVIRGSRPVLWTLPFYVKWDGQEAEIWAAASLRAKEERAVKAVILEHGREFNGMYRIPRFDLNRIARRVENEDPEQHLSWERPMIMQPAGDLNGKVRERRDFLDALYHNGRGHSRAEIEYWWQVFCHHMFDWLLNKEKPVDFYFCKLHNLPLRHGWQAVLSHKIKALNRSLSLVRSKESLRQIRKDPVFKTAIESLDLVATAKLSHGEKSPFVMRRLEIEPKYSWEFAMWKAEKTRLKAMGPVLYVQNLICSIRRQHFTMARLYQRWIAGVAAPSGQLCPRVMGGEPELLHKRLNTQLREDGPWSGVHRREFAAEARVDRDHEKALAATPGGLPPMLALSQKIAHVRYSRGDESRRGKRKFGFPRVLVPDGSEVAAESELLAVRPVEGAGGVATPTELVPV